MNIRMYDRIQAGEFNSKLSFPEEKEDPAFIEATKKLNTARERMETLTIARKQLRRKRQEALREEQTQIIKAFREALEEEYGMGVHLNRDKFWNKAWEDGHANGFTEVLSVYQDLIELIA